MTSSLHFKYYSVIQLNGKDQEGGQIQSPLQEHNKFYFPDSQKFSFWESATFQIYKLLRQLPNHKSTLPSINNEVRYGPGTVNNLCEGD